MAEEKKTPQTGGTENKKVVMNFGGTDIEATIDKDGRIIMPEEIQQLLAAGASVMRQASQETAQAVAATDAPQGGGTVLKDGVADNFKGLPMRELISAPLIAAAEAQQELASTAWDFYQRIAFDKGENGKGNTRILEFTVDRPIEQNGTITKMTQNIKAPFIGLVPIPSLLIDRIDVDFQMEVTTTENSKSTVTSDVSTNISSGWFVKAEISGKVSTARENTRSTNQAAKYQVHVSASQQPQTEGLSKLMDIMASCIDPMTPTKEN